jgi:SAM-dependent methyltransferase
MTANDRELRETFDNVPDIYHEIRPRYPPALFDALFALLPARPRVLEVGPGTGQATSDLLARGATVHGVEIGVAMAAKLRAVLPTNELTITIGDFELVPQEPAAYDCVTSATAYHWIARDAQRDRPAAFLKPGGIVAIIDLIHVASPDDHGFFAAAQPIYRRYDGDEETPQLPQRGETDPPMRAALENDDRFRDVRVHRYDWNQAYTAAEYRKLLLSYSGTHAMAPDAQVAFLDEMEQLIRADFAGQVTRPLVVTLTTAALVNM